MLGTIISCKFLVQSPARSVPCFFPEEKTVTCQKCKLVRLLEENIQSLQERITTLQEIKEGEDFIDKSLGTLQEHEEESQGEEGSISLLSPLSVLQYKY
ncbi:UNVERIFIED_CONTAM: hypothetical protein K2H54_026833 [Gekko kuhli]